MGDDERMEVAEEDENEQGDDEYEGEVVLDMSEDEQDSTQNKTSTLIPVDGNEPSPPMVESDRVGQREAQEQRLHENLLGVRRGPPAPQGRRLGGGGGDSSTDGDQMPSTIPHKTKWGPCCELTPARIRRMQAVRRR